MINELYLHEISLVDCPANPHCKILSVNGVDPIDNAPPEAYNRDVVKEIGVS